MNGIELVAFGALWCIFAALTALVALLYRQVERAYQRSAAVQAAGIVAGNEIPDLEVATETGVEPLEHSPDGSLAIMAFVTPECDACKALLGDLKVGFDGVDRILVLVNGETSGALREAVRDLEILWLAHPNDAVRHYGVTVVPLVYVVRGRMVLASGVASHGSEVNALIQRALEFEEGQEFLASAGASRDLVPGQT